MRAAGEQQQETPSTHASAIKPERTPFSTNKQTGSPGQRHTADMPPPAPSRSGHPSQTRSRPAHMPPPQTPSTHASATIKPERTPFSDKQQTGSAGQRQTAHILPLSSSRGHPSQTRNRPVRLVKDTPQTCLRQYTPSTHASATIKPERTPFSDKQQTGSPGQRHTAHTPPLSSSRCGHPSQTRNRPVRLVKERPHTCLRQYTPSTHASAIIKPERTPFSDKQQIDSDGQRNTAHLPLPAPSRADTLLRQETESLGWSKTCLLYTSPSPRDRQKSRMPSSA